MKTKKTKKDLKETDNYIMIRKDILLDWTLMTVFIIAVIIFIALLASILYNLIVPDNKPAIDMNMVEYYKDENLNINYPIPGGDWSVVEIDTSEEKDTAEVSAGEDSYFSIEDDKLTAEVLSLLTVNQSSETGFREFMSFTFMPDVAYQENEFVSFCKESFSKNIEDSGSYNSFEIYEVTEDKFNGVLMKAKITQTVEPEGEEPSEEETYYTQYIKRIGKNIGVITYGSLIEDESVDIYLQYFLNNVVTEKSLQG